MAAAAVGGAACNSRYDLPSWAALRCGGRHHDQNKSFVQSYVNAPLVYYIRKRLSSCFIECSYYVKLQFHSQNSTVAGLRLLSVFCNQNMTRVYL